MNKYCECYSHYRQEFNSTCGSCGGSGVPGNTRVKQLEALRVANIENENALLNRIAELEAENKALRLASKDLGFAGAIIAEQGSEVLRTAAKYLGPEKNADTVSGKADT